MKVFKEANVLFQAERVAAKFKNYSQWIAVILGFKSGGCATIKDYDDFELGWSVYPEERLGLARNKVV